MKHKLYYATGNPIKFAELDAFFKAYPEFELKQHAEDLPEIQSSDQKKIALAKAHHAWTVLQQPVLVDDAGIFFTKYRNFPGTLTKYVYQSLGMQNVAKLYEHGDSACFQIHLVYYAASDKYHIFEQTNMGTLIKPDRWEEDPQAPFEYIFVPDGCDKTYAELRKIGQLEQHKYRVAAAKRFVEWYCR